MTYTETLCLIAGIKAECTCRGWRRFLFVAGFAQFGWGRQLLSFFFALLVKINETQSQSFTYRRFGNEYRQSQKTSEATFVFGRRIRGFIFLR